MVMKEYKKYNEERGMFWVSFEYVDPISGNKYNSELFEVSPDNYDEQVVVLQSQFAHSISEQIMSEE